MSNLPVGLPFMPDSAASKEAAEQATAFAPGARRLVFEFIKANPGCTDKEIQTKLGMNPNTERPRRRELEEEELIRAAGENAKGSDKTRYKVTGKEFPDPWPTKKSSFKKWLSGRPTATEMTVTVETMRKAFKLFEAAGEPFPQEAIAVLKWLDRR